MIKRKSLFFILLAIVFLGVCLRFYQLGASSLWIDEIFTASRAKSSLIDLFVKSPEEASFGYAPMDRLFVHFAYLFGKSEFTVRFPSAVFGILTIILIYQFANTFFSKKMGLIAAYLLSISALHLEYSREARYYVFVVFFSLLAFYFFLKILKGSKKKFIFLYTISIFINLLSHLTTLIFLGLQLIFGLFLVLKHRWTEIRKSRPNKNFLIGIVFLIILIYYLKGYLLLFKAIKISYPASFMALVSYTFTKLSGAGGWATVLFLLFFLVGILALFKKSRQEAVLLMILFFIPPLALFFARPEGYTYHIRYVIFILPIWLLIVSFGIDYLAGLSKQWRSLTLFLILLLFSLAGAKSIRSYYTRPTEDWRELGQYLEKTLQPGDVVITESKYRQMNVDYYFNAATKGAFVKTILDSLTQRPKKYPFRAYYLQHDYITLSNKMNSEALPLVSAELEKPVLFNAGDTTMYLLRSKPIYFWQEGEEGWVENVGWGVADFWGQKVISADTLAYPSAQIAYKISLSQSGNYDLYANIRWDGARGVIKFRIDSGEWSSGFQPFFGEKGDVTYKWRMKEINLGRLHLTAGDHKITFLNQKASDGIGRYQTIDYFYLASNEEKPKD